MTGHEYQELYEESPDKAYSMLFDNYCDYVYAIVFNKLRSTASRADIEECVSDIFADIFFGLKPDDHSGDLKGYIGTVAKRRAINAFYRLAGGRLHQSDDSDELLALIRSEENIETESDNKEVSRILMGKIEELGRPDSVIILQKYYYQRSSAEIAELLSMKASTVRMRASRALGKLKKSLAATGIVYRKGDADYE
ncbi:MAG: sigma-70 family RNA polymerase sigma factor [Oscillospiraceae bacterium]|nr:sigma-70 family RNA polymerase sigma factor [Oscillospiraceae bacterium]MBP1592682.1 sigma-70 family RNA polymerase sigma factor [Oscillospiraceae bacterium]